MDYDFVDPVAVAAGADSFAIETEEMTTTDTGLTTTDTGLTTTDASKLND